TKIVETPLFKTLKRKRSKVNPMVEAFFASRRVFEAAILRHITRRSRAGRRKVERRKTEYYGICLGEPDESCSAERPSYSAGRGASHLEIQADNGCRSRPGVRLGQAAARTGADRRYLPWPDRDARRAGHGSGAREHPSNVH